MCEGEEECDHDAGMLETEDTHTRASPSLGTQHSASAPHTPAAAARAPCRWLVGVLNVYIDVHIYISAQYSDKVSTSTLPSSR